MQEKPYDAVLVRLYWLSQKGDDGVVKPSLRTRLSDRACYQLYKNGIVDNFVLAVGCTWGPNYISQAEAAKKDLMRYSIPESSIHVQPDALTSDEETRVLLSLAQKNIWNKLGDLYFKTHEPAIRHVDKNRGKDIDPIVVEDVLKAYDDRRVSHLVDRLSKSPYETGFKVYEIVAMIRLALARGNYERLNEWARANRKEKGHNPPWARRHLLTGVFPFNLFAPIDKYEL